MSTNRAKYILSKTRKPLFRTTEENHIIFLSSLKTERKCVIYCNIPTLCFHYYFNEILRKKYMIEITVTYAVSYFFSRMCVPHMLLKCVLL